MNEQTYVIWLEFDDEFTTFLDEKCLELNANNIAPGIRPPHMTLTFVKTDNRERLIEFTKNYLQENIEDIVIGSISQFPGGILYYAPHINSKLLNLHTDLCRGLCEFCELTWELYYPGNWTPHIALTAELNDQDVLKAFSIMRRDFSSRTVSVKRILIWAYNGDGEKIYIDV